MKNTMPSIKEIVYVAPQKDWSFPLHSHEASAELSLITKGRGTFYAMNAQRPVQKGMMVAKNPGLSHAEKSDPNDPLEQICIEIENVRIEGLSENFVIPAGSDPVIELGDSFELIRACFRFFMAHQEDRSCEDINRRLLDIVIELIRKKRSSPQQAGARPRGKKELATELLNYLDEHYREKLRIKDLAELFYVSEGNLSRQFKAVTGYTVNEYLTLLTTKVVGFLLRRPLHCCKSFSFTRSPQA